MMPIGVSEAQTERSTMLGDERFEMRASIAALGTGMVGFLLGWLTRPFVEGQNFALTIRGTLHHAVAYEDRLLRAAAHATILHVAMFGIACALLGFVVARFLQNR
jgi:cell division inhibitor SulA